MFCSKCGKEINASIAFCPSCGQPTGLSAAQPVVSEPLKTEQIENAVQPIYIPENNYAPVVPVAAPKKKRLGLILGITIPAVILVLAIIIICLIMKKKRMSNNFIFKVLISIKRVLNFWANTLFCLLIDN